MAPKKLISVVTPCYNEEDNAPECYRTIREIFEKELPEYDYEHIFCDNASTDRTVEVMKGFARQDGRVKLIVNSRNFGPFHSNFNGILSTRGDAVVLFLAADMQDPPELIPRFVRLWEEGYEVVYGVRKVRQESRLLRSIRSAYYGMVYNLSSIKLLPHVGEYQLVDRVVVEALREFEDYYPYIRGMVAYCGFRSTGVEYTWRARKRGFSKNSLLNLVDQGLNGLVSFTKIPLRICMGAGLLIAILSFIYAFVSLVISAVYFRKFAPPGIQTLIVALFFFSGVQLFFFGVLGEYIAAIHFQVRKRPVVVERERVNFEDEGAFRARGRPAAPAPEEDRVGSGGGERAGR
jgi:glycosyltransferase involved in cell wall biosynthesis